jgi:hypothetical protein
MKKLFIILLAISVIFLTACSMSNSNNSSASAENLTVNNSLSEQSNVLSPQEQNTVFITTPTEGSLLSSSFDNPTTSNSKLNASRPTLPTASSAIIASLTKEDGSGTIYLGMPVEQLMLTLDAIDLSYEVERFESGDIAFIAFEDGTTYDFYDGLFRQTDPAQTFSGLKMGDPISKALELYGSCEDSSDWTGRTLYLYETKENIVLRIGAKGTSANAPIDYLVLEWIPDGYYDSEGAGM